ncbi:MAG: hypothetical protein AB7U24_08360 [Sulfurimonadaceae bacterium]|jgi:hypothetical protein
MEQIVMIGILVVMSAALCYAFVREHYYEIRYNLNLVRERIARNLLTLRVK